MLDTKKFGIELQNFGFRFYSGVPCSFLKDFINFAINDCRYIIAANEGDAVATCAGAYLGGVKSVFLCQNSGLTNAVSPLTSLNHIFKIPVLGFVSLRGETGIPDEPQHELMGLITTEMLDLMQIHWEYLANENSEAINQLKRAADYIEEHQSFFFVVRKGTFSEIKLQEQKPSFASIFNKISQSQSSVRPSRYEVLTMLNNVKDKDTILMATTGKTGRELYEIEDAPNNFYMVGSMGCISQIGLGLALTQSTKKVIVIDGDGALLMRMGSMATNAYYQPTNLLHLMLDNNAYDSTGGQLTVSGQVNFVELASAAGYPNVIFAHNLKELCNALCQWMASGGLTFIQVKIDLGSRPELGRPKVKPSEVAERLMRFIGSYQ